MGRGDPVERRKRLRGWRWSSYRGYSGLGKAERWVNQERVLGEIGGVTKERRLRYRRFVEEGLLREIENPLEAVQWQTALGREHFLQRLRDHVERKGKRTGKCQLCDRCGAELKRDRSLTAWRSLWLL